MRFYASRSNVSPGELNRLHACTFSSPRVSIFPSLLHTKRVLYPFCVPLFVATSPCWLTALVIERKQALPGAVALSTWIKTTWKPPPLFLMVYSFSGFTAKK